MLKDYTLALSMQFARNYKMDLLRDNHFLRTQLVVTTSQLMQYFCQVWSIYNILTYLEGAGVVLNEI
jgi:hypothetical protein